MTDFPVVWVACGTILVLIAMLLSNVCRRIRFPYTIALVIVGMLINDIGEHIPRLAKEGNEIVQSQLPEDLPSAGF